MRWPFVTRSIYEADCNYLRTKIEAEREINALLRAELIEQRQEVRDANGLVKALLSPVLAKQQPKAIEPPKEKSENEKAWGEIRKIVREQSGGNIQLAAHLTTYANQLKREGKTTDEIAGKLVEWQTSELAVEDHT